MGLPVCILGFFISAFSLVEVINFDERADFLERTVGGERVFVEENYYLLTVRCDVGDTAILANVIREAQNQSTEESTGNINAARIECQNIQYEFDTPIVEYTTLGGTQVIATGGANVPLSYHFAVDYINEEQAGLITTIVNETDSGSRRRSLETERKKLKQQTLRHSTPSGRRKALNRERKRLKAEKLTARNMGISVEELRSEPRSRKRQAPEVTFDNAGLEDLFACGSFEELLPTGVAGNVPQNPDGRFIYSLKVKKQAGRIEDGWAQCCEANFNLKGSRKRNLDNCIDQLTGQVAANAFQIQLLTEGLLDLVEVSNTTLQLLDQVQAQTNLNKNSLDGIAGELTNIQDTVRSLATAGKNQARVTTETTVILAQTQVQLQQAIDQSNANFDTIQNELSRLGSEIGQTAQFLSAQINTVATATEQALAQQQAAIYNDIFEVTARLQAAIDTVQFDAGLALSYSSQQQDEINNDQEASIAIIQEEVGRLSALMTDQYLVVEELSALLLGNPALTLAAWTAYQTILDTPEFFRLFQDNPGFRPLIVEEWNAIGIRVLEYTALISFNSAFGPDCPNTSEQEITDLLNDEYMNAKLDWWVPKANDRNFVQLNDNSVLFIPADEAKKRSMVDRFLTASNFCLLGPDEPSWLGDNNAITGNPNLSRVCIADNPAWNIRIDFVQACLDVKRTALWYGDLIYLRIEDPFDADEFRFLGTVAASREFNTTGSLLPNERYLLVAIDPTLFLDGIAAGADSAITFQVQPYIGTIDPQNPEVRAEQGLVLNYVFAEEMGHPNYTIFASDAFGADYTYLTGVEANSSFFKLKSEGTPAKKKRALPATEDGLSVKRQRRARERVDVVKRDFEIMTNKRAWGTNMGFTISECQQRFDRISEQQNLTLYTSNQLFYTAANLRALAETPAGDASGDACPIEPGDSTTGLACSMITTRVPRGAWIAFGKYEYDPMMMLNIWTVVRGMNFIEFGKPLIASKQNGLKTSNLEVWMAIPAGWEIDVRYGSQLHPIPGAGTTVIKRFQGPDGSPGQPDFWVYRTFMNMSAPIDGEFSVSPNGFLNKAFCTESTNIDGGPTYETSCMFYPRGQRYWLPGDQWYNSENNPAPNDPYFYEFTNWTADFGNNIVSPTEQTTPILYSTVELLSIPDQLNPRSVEADDPPTLHGCWDGCRNMNGPTTTQEAICNDPDYLGSQCEWTYNAPTNTNLCLDKSLSTCNSTDVSTEQGISNCLRDPQFCSVDQVAGECVQYSVSPIQDELRYRLPCNERTISSTDRVGCALSNQAGYTASIGTGPIWDFCFFMRSRTSQPPDDQVCFDVPSPASNVSFQDATQDCFLPGVECFFNTVLGGSVDRTALFYNTFVNTELNGASYLGSTNCAIFNSFLDECEPKSKDFEGGHLVSQCEVTGSSCTKRCDLLTPSGPQVCVDSFNKDFYGKCAWIWNNSGVGNATGSGGICVPNNFDTANIADPCQQQDYPRRCVTIRTRNNLWNDYNGGPDRPNAVNNSLSVAWLRTRAHDCAIDLNGEYTWVAYPTLFNDTGTLYPEWRNYNLTGDPVVALDAVQFTDFYLGEFTQSYCEYTNYIVDAYCFNPTWPVDGYCLLTDPNGYFAATRELSADCVVQQVDVFDERPFETRCLEAGDPLTNRSCVFLQIARGSQICLPDGSYQILQLEQTYGDTGLLTIKRVGQAPQFTDEYTLYTNISLLELQANVLRNITFSTPAEVRAANIIGSPVDGAETFYQCTAPVPPGVTLTPEEYWQPVMNQCCPRDRVVRNVFGGNNQFIYYTCPPDVALRYRNPRHPSTIYDTYVRAQCASSPDPRVSDRANGTRVNLPVYYACRIEDGTLDNVTSCPCGNTTFPCPIPDPMDTTTQDNFTCYPFIRETDCVDLAICARLPFTPCPVEIPVPRSNETFSAIRLTAGVINTLAGLQNYRLYNFSLFDLTEWHDVSMFRPGNPPDIEMDAATLDTFEYLSFIWDMDMFSTIHGLNSMYGLNPAAWGATVSDGTNVNQEQWVIRNNEPVALYSSATFGAITPEVIEVREYQNSRIYCNARIVETQGLNQTIVRQLQPTTCTATDNRLNEVPQNGQQFIHKYIPERGIVVSVPDDLVRCANFDYEARLGGVCGYVTGGLPYHINFTTFVEGIGRENYDPAIFSNTPMRYSSFSDDPDSICGVSYGTEFDQTSELENLLDLGYLRALTESFNYTDYLGRPLDEGWNADAISYEITVLGGQFVYSYFIRFLRRIPALWLLRGCTVEFFNMVLQSNIVDLVAQDLLRIQWNVFYSLLQTEITTNNLVDPDVILQVEEELTLSVFTGEAGFDSGLQSYIDTRILPWCGNCIQACNATDYPQKDSNALSSRFGLCRLTQFYEVEKFQAGNVDRVNLTLREGQGSLLLTFRIPADQLVLQAVTSIVDVCPLGPGSPNNTIQYVCDVVQGINSNDCWIQVINPSAQSQMIIVTIVQFLDPLDPMVPISESVETVQLVPAAQVNLLRPIGEGLWRFLVYTQDAFTNITGNVPCSESDVINVTFFTDYSSIFGNNVLTITGDITQSNYGFATERLAQGVYIQNAGNISAEVDEILTVIGPIIASGINVTEEFINITDEIADISDQLGNITDYLDQIGSANGTLDQIESDLNRTQMEIIVLQDEIDSLFDFYDDLEEQIIEQQDEFLNYTVQTDARFDELEDEFFEALEPLEDQLQAIEDALNNAGIPISGNGTSPNTLSAEANYWLTIVSIVLVGIVLGLAIWALVKAYKGSDGGGKKDKGNRKNKKDEQQDTKSTPFKRAVEEAQNRNYGPLRQQGVPVDELYAYFNEQYGANGLKEFSNYLQNSAATIGQYVDPPGFQQWLSAQQSAAQAAQTVTQTPTRPAALAGGGIGRMVGALPALKRL